MKQEVYLKEIIPDKFSRARFIHIIRKVCGDNSIKFPFRKNTCKAGNLIILDKELFDRIYQHILERFHNSSYRYSGLNNYPQYQILKKIYESQGWELPKNED